MKDKRWSNLMQAWLQTPVVAPIPSNQKAAEPYRSSTADVDLLSDGSSCLDTLDLDFSQLDRQHTISAAQLQAAFPDFAKTDPASTHVTIWSYDSRGARQLVSSFTRLIVIESPGGVSVLAPDAAKSLTMQMHQGKHVSAEMPL